MDTVEREVTVPATPGEVWPAVTQSDEVSAWFGADAQLEVRPGGRGVFRWRDGTERHVVVEDVEPPRRLSFRWLPFQRTGGRRDRHRALDPGGDHPRRGARGHARAGGGAAGVLARVGAGALRRPRAGGDRIVKRDRTDAIFTALADATRRQVIRALSEQGPATATGLAANLPVTRQAVTKHLSALAEAGLVTATRRGREKLYQISPRPLTDAVSWMADLGGRWDERLAALRDHIAAPRRRR